MMVALIMLTDDCIGTIAHAHRFALPPCSPQFAGIVRNTRWRGKTGTVKVLQVVVGPPLFGGLIIFFGIGAV